MNGFQRVYSRVVGRNWLSGTRILSVFGGQAAISLQTFVSAIVMIRSGTPAEFGLYTTILAGINFVAALQVALVVGPLLILVPGVPLSRQRSLTASLWVFSLAFALLIFLITLVAYMTFGLKAEPSHTSLELLLASFAYFLIYQGQEFFRRVLQIHRDFSGASACDWLTLMVISLIVPVLWYLKLPGKTSDHFVLTARDGLIMLCASGLAGLIL